MHGVVSALHDAKTKRYKKYPSDKSSAKTSRRTLQTTAFALLFRQDWRWTLLQTAWRLTTQRSIIYGHPPVLLAPFLRRKRSSTRTLSDLPVPGTVLKSKNFAAYLAAQIKLWCLCATRLFSPKCQYKCLPNEPQHASALHYQAYITLPTVTISETTTKKVTQVGW